MYIQSFTSPGTYCTLELYVKMTDLIFSSPITDLALRDAYVDLKVRIDRYDLQIT